MNAFLMDASTAPGDRTSVAADALEAALTSSGANVTRIALRDLTIRPCTGCFGCWTKRPGECLIDDDARRLARETIGSDLLAIATPVSFGSWGSLAKSALDRMICLILPHFTSINGETHHQPRYPRYPRWIALGTSASMAPDTRALFERLVAGNAINLHSPAHAATVIADEREAPHAALELLKKVEVQS